MKAYRFPDWDELYESNKSREVETLTYFLQPNKLVGEGLGFLRQQPNWLQLYGAFCWLKTLASLTPRPHRGWLIRRGTPLTPERIMALTGIPTAIIQTVLEFFSSEQMGWLIHEEITPSPRQIDALKTQGKKWIDDTKTAGRGQIDDTKTAGRGQIDDTISSGLTDLRKTDLRKTEDLKNKKQNGGFASPDEARKAQSQQFAAAQSKLTALEAVDPDERTAAQDRELKEWRGVIRAIQKKQARADFSPVPVEEAA